MEHVCRSYSIVMHQPLIHVLKIAREEALKSTMLSNSICSLRLLKEHIHSTNNLECNTKIQLENFIVLSEQFSGVKIRAYLICSMLYLAYLLTSTRKDPIDMVNSVWYCGNVTPKGHKLADLF